MTREQVWRMVVRITAPLARKVHLTVARAVVQLVDDATKMQSTQVEIYDDQIRDGVEHFQSPGISHVPTAGAEGVMLSVGGDTSHGLLVNASNRDQRPTGMTEGETRVWDKTGSKMHLKSDGDIAVVPSGSYVHVGGDPADVFIAKADLTDARIGALETKVINMVAIFIAHIHKSTEAFAPQDVSSGGRFVTMDPTLTPQVPPAVGSTVAASIGKVS